MVGTVLAIARREKSRAPMQELEAAEITEDAGLAGDFRGRPGDRQVTVLSRESWEAACGRLGRDVAWTTRRANVLVSGIELESTTGRELRIGEVRLEITGETDPCSRMDEQEPGLRTALEPAWRGGVTCRVRAGGTIRRGDEVRWGEST